MRGFCANWHVLGDCPHCLFLWPACVLDSCFGQPMLADCLHCCEFAAVVCPCGLHECWVPCVSQGVLADC